MKDMYKNKRILFSTDGILGYKDSVEKELKNRFGYVKYIEKDIDQSCKKDIIYKMLREISKKLNKNNVLKQLFKKYQNKYIEKLFEKLNEKFDYFLVVAGQEFSIEFIKKLKEKNPDIVTILFLWDTLEETALKNSAFQYDYIFSFDPEDCKKHNFIFRPIFYIEECEKNVPQYSEKKYDIYYLGALRDKKRYNIVKEFKKYSDLKKLNSFLKVIYNKKSIKILKNNLDNDEILCETKISYKENREILKNSRVVLDLNFERQNGLTIRASEALGTKTKVITTNKYIKKYDFYNEKNIYFIEKLEEIKDIPLSFFEEEYIEIDKEIKNRYTTKGFIDDIFNNIK